MTLCITKSADVLETLLEASQFLVERGNVPFGLARYATRLITDIFNGRNVTIDEAETVARFICEFYDEAIDIVALLDHDARPAFARAVRIQNWDEILSQYSSSPESALSTIRTKLLEWAGI